MLSLVTEMNDTILDMVLNRKLDGGFISSPGEHPSLNEVFLKKEGRHFNLQILKKGTLIQRKPPGRIQEEGILWKDGCAGYTLEV
jgi:hypothetical protein